MFRRGLTALAAAGLLATSMPVMAQAAEVTVRITHVKALDVIDAASPADFLAIVSVGGEKPCATPIVKDKNEIRPTDWVCTFKVPAGVHDVKVRLADKDIAVNDPVDINRLPNKRDLDFKINTQNCVISGFAQIYTCGAAITRSGDERKKALITFVVTARR
jgi:hypothetical protein